MSDMWPSTVQYENPSPREESEYEKIAEAARELGLYTHPAFKDNDTEE